MVDSDAEFEADARENPIVIDIDRSEAAGDREEEQDEDDEQEEQEDQEDEADGESGRARKVLFLLVVCAHVCMCVPVCTCVLVLQGNVHCVHVRAGR